MLSQWFPASASLPEIGDRAGTDIKQYDFSEPQSRKDVCDRKIAPMKAQITCYINEKHNMLSASDMKQVIETHGGVQEVRVTVAKTSGPTNGTAWGEQVGRNK